MPPWTTTPNEVGHPPPGAVAPPPPDQITPADPGWAAWARQETVKAGLKVSDGCAVSLQVSATGAMVVRALGGDDPDDYATDAGWKEDRVYETTPPEPYQDFTRWVRHYPNVHRQKYVQYVAVLIVRCGASTVRTPTTFFWAADGPEESGEVDVFDWTKTSGIKTGEDGKAVKWETTGKKTPPSWTERKPPETTDLGHPQTTPPWWVVDPLPEYKFDHDFKLDPGLKYHFGDDFRPAPYEPNGKPLKWLPIRDLF